MKAWVLILAAAGASAQKLEDKAQEAKAILDRAIENVLNTTQRLPRYMCTETINREYFEPAQALGGKEVCSAGALNNFSKLATASTDRIRLDVAVAEGGEIDSWPAASKFDTRNIDEIVTTGPISTGAFGVNLMQVFENEGAKYQFTGVKTEAGVRSFLFHYSVGLETSHFMVKMMDGTRWKTPYSGDFEIVATTAELARLSIETDRLSPDTGMCRAQTTNFYHHVKVGSGEFLIPIRSILRTIRPDGSATESVTTFSACHEYGAESTIRFDADDAPPAEASQKAAAERAAAALPWGTELVLKLESAIDTETVAAGDIVWATVAQPVRNPKSKQIALPAGTRVRGRIMQVTHYISEDRGFDISIVFDRYEIQGATGPFGAILKPAKVRVAGTDVVLRAVDSGGLLTVRTKAPKAVLPQGFESKWIAATPKAKS